MNGTGEVVGGIALKRDGADSLATIDNIKAKIAQITPGLLEGVSIKPVYDRSQLIGSAIHTLKHILLELCHRVRERAFETITDPIRTFRSVGAAITRKPESLFF